MTEKFSLQWNDFLSNISNSFGLLRNEEYLHDVTLVTDDQQQLAAHKLVLSVCSGYFQNVFKMNQNPNLVICLEGVNRKDLDNCLDYM